MKHDWIAWGWIIGTLAAGSPALAHEHTGAHDVVPAQERERAAGQGFDGPTENRAIAPIVTLGAVDLGSEFPGLAGRQLRAREITVLPGGVVAVHQHNGRPGLAYILEGTIIEHRNDHPDPIVRTVGAVAFEKTGVTHWWENVSTAPVRALVVDVFTPPP